MTIPPGERLGHYTIISRLGAGGMGEVYHARDEHLHRDVAIKVLPDTLTADAEASSRFQREARAIAALSHPNVVAIYQFDSNAPTPYLVMELLHGETLAARIARAPLPWRKAIEIAASIAEALGFAHDQAIVHRDLKPSNVWITTHGQVKVLDFGLARHQPDTITEHSPTATRPGTVLGTIGYMSPEQITGQTVDARSDLFALGCVLYEMLTGRNPFARGTFRETTAAVLGHDPMAGHDLDALAPREVLAIMARCLEKNREERFQSARDLAFRLRELTSGVATTSEPLPGRRRFVRLALAVALLIAAGTWISTRNFGDRISPGPAEPRAYSLLVVPFENTGGAADAEFLADGITEGLINTLATLPRVRVIARTTSFTYKGKPLDFGRARRELDVDTALMGKVVSRGESLTVQTELVDLASGSTLWGERYHQAVSDPHTIERTIVAAIAERLRVRLSSDQEKRLQARRTDSREAYERYLRGRHEWNKRTPDGLRRAEEYFQQAVAADPTFALAYSGLADTYTIMVADFRLMPREVGLPRAEQAALQAVALDPDLAEARGSLAQLHHSQWNWISAEREFKRAIELNPNYATARMWYSLALRDVGRLHESLREVRIAQQLDPLSPIVTANVAQKLLVIRAYDEALVEAMKAVELNPTFVYAHMNVAMAYEGLGRYDEAAESWRRMSEAGGPVGLGRAGLGRGYAKTDRVS